MKTGVVIGLKNNNDRISIHADLHGGIDEMFETVKEKIIDYLHDGMTLENIYFFQEKIEEVQL